jgi:CheY-like chemotaxis protein
MIDQESQKGRTVLVVDDDEDIRESLREVLEAEKYAVRTAADGKDALAVLAAATPRPSLILLDLMMPGMNGWELLKVLKADAGFAEIPVVVLSASHSRVESATSVLRKPIALETLLTVVQTHCERSKSS